MSECGEYTVADTFCRLPGVFDGRCRVHRVLPTAGGREAFAVSWSLPVAECGDMSLLSLRELVRSVGFGVDMVDEL